MAETEQNKTEEPTPHKLRHAREKGMLARGVDLGFFSGLAGLSVFALLAGERAFAGLAQLTRQLLAQAGTAGAHTGDALSFVALGSQKPLALIAAFALTIVCVVVLFEIVQLRGLVVSTHPLKPDFNRLNPAKNLKRLVSLRLLKETLKSIAKLIVYAAALFLVVKAIALPLAHALPLSDALADAWREGFTRLLLSFALIAFVFALIDQALVRRAFLKEMRMSRSELQREIKDREGEPRQKQKRKRMHAEFIKQTRALAGLRGADVLIVNPEHYAVGLRYTPGEMEAPRIVAKGRNRFALILKKRAAHWSILTVSDPPLARALYRAGEVGHDISGAHYRAVADLYLRIRRSKGHPAHA